MNAHTNAHTRTRTQVHANIHRVLGVGGQSVQMRLSTKTFRIMYIKLLTVTLDDPCLYELYKKMYICYWCRLLCQQKLLVHYFIIALLTYSLHHSYPTICLWMHMLWECCYACYDQCGKCGKPMRACACTCTHNLLLKFHLRLNILHVRARIRCVCFHRVIVSTQEHDCGA